jgi:hypothetical protein
MEKKQQKPKVQEQEEKSKESLISKKRGRPPKEIDDSNKKVEEITTLKESPQTKKRIKTSIKKIQEVNDTPKQESTDTQQVIKLLDGHYQTPVLPVKYSSVKKPYKFANNDIPRYSITLILDEKKNKSFISKLESLRTQQGAENFRNELSYVNERGFKISSGKSLIKFQRKEKIPVYDKSGEELELTAEIPEKTMVSVVFEVRCYLNKRSNQNAFNLSPSQIFIHEVPESEKK